MKLITKIKAILYYIKSEYELRRYIPSYKVAEIFQDEDGNYNVAIQVINKSSYFYSRPEEILSNDGLVDQFSPRDVRVLTYLGYLQINSPKYEILAKKLAAGSDKFIFALKKRGEKSIITKTADQIMQDEKIIANMNSEDASTIGYTLAAENTQFEQSQMDNLLKRIENNNK